MTADLRGSVQSLSHNHSGRGFYDVSYQVRQPQVGEKNIQLIQFLALRSCPSHTLLILSFFLWARKQQALRHVATIRTTFLIVNMVKLSAFSLTQGK